MYRMAGTPYKDFDRDGRQPSSYESPEAKAETETGQMRTGC